MRNLWLVLKREYSTRVRSKAFIFSTLALPVFGAGVLGLSIYLNTQQPTRTLDIAIDDEQGGLASAVAAGLSEKVSGGKPAFHVVATYDRPGPGKAVELRSQVQQKTLGGFLLIPQGILEGKPAEFHTRNTGQALFSGSLDAAVSTAVVAARLAARGIHVGDISRLVHGVDVNVIKVTRHGESEEKGQSFFVAMAMGMLLYITLLVYGVTTMRSVLEEKTTRIVEILVSSVRPLQLLGGKVLGVAAVGITQYAIWGTLAFVLAAYGASMARASMSAGASMPHIHLPVLWLVYLLLFFLAGYFLYASLYAAVGATVSSDQEAQQMQMPLTIIIVASFFLLFRVIRDPNSTFSVVLSLVPFLSPILMVARIATETPPLWQIVLALTLSVATTAVVVWFSSRIYRVGILMYGKRPSLVELARWLRYT